jgi:hypothetical protein
VPIEKTTEYLAPRDFLRAPSNPLVISGKLIDGRKGEAITYRHMCASLVEDLGGEVSSAQAALIRRAATLMMMAEKYEHRFLAGEDVDVERYHRVITPLAKLLNMLGLRAAKRDGSTAKVIDADPWASHVTGADDA